jgi:hypothetical protein
MSNFWTKLGMDYTKWHQLEFANDVAHKYGEHNPGTYAYLSLYGQNYSLKEIEDFLNEEDVIWSSGFKGGIKQYIQERRDDLMKAWIED